MIGEPEKPQWKDDADEEYRIYRGTALGVSATAIAIASGLLAWATGRTGVVGTLQQLSAFATVVGAYLIQSFQFRGQQHRARSYFHKESNIELSNRWFRRADRALNATECLLAATVLLSAWLKATG